MLNFQDLSLKRKQQLIIMLTSSVALLLACAAFVAYDTITFRQLLVKKESSMAEVVGKTVTAAIDFNDQKTAEESLAALRAEPSIVAACIYDRDGRVFATYRRDAGTEADGFPAAGAAGHEFTGNQLHLFEDIEQGNGKVGTIFVASDLAELSQRLERYAGIVGLVFFASLLIALGLSSRLQRVISNPILELAQLARLVALEKNYSLRAKKPGINELGQLVDGFNEMLDQIQQRDTALQAARENLEQRVEERTAELAYEQGLLRTLLDHAPDHIYFKDAQSRFIKSSSSQAKQFGLGSPDDLVGKSDFDFFTEDHARVAFEDEQNIIRTGQPMIGKIERELWKDGRGESWVLSTKMPFCNKAGEIIGTFGISKDITALKRTEAELSYERDLLDSLMDNFPDPIYFKDLESRFVRVSRSKLARTLVTGREQHLSTSGTDELPPHLDNPEEFSTFILGKTDFDFLPETFARAMYEDEQQIIRTGVPLIGKLNEITGPGGKTTWAITTKMRWRDRNGNVIGTFGTTKDITPIKEAEARVAEAHKQLLEISRQAGMAEIATNVLHNVGNVLNSVNVSAALVADSAKKSKISYLEKVVALLNEHAADLGVFMTVDPQGRQLPGFLSQLAGQLAREQQNTITELELLRQNIEHIKDIVAMQQNYAKISGVTDTIKVTELVEDALRMNAGALARHEVELIREYSDVPAITVEKHKVVQILVNLIRNAKYACDDSGRQDKQLRVRIAGTDGGVQIAVIDNGIGIPPENLTRIFNHGFTTRKGGHGFGLHGGALTAKELGGALTVESQGTGHGATFILELPSEPCLPEI